MKMQRIVKMGSRPATAGLAQLEFLRGSGKMPERRESRILIPYDDTTEFAPLSNGSQFLVCYGSAEVSFFGGTDEHPFLTDLPLKREDAEQLSEYQFYENLKPGLIKDLESRWGEKLTRRQGDIFAFPLSLPQRYHARANWRMILITHTDGDSMGRGSRTEKMSAPQAVNEFPLFGTRHKLTGALLLFPYYTSGLDTIGSGVLTAPDHAPLILQGPHIFVRSGMVGWMQE